MTPAARKLLEDPRIATLFAALAKTGAETRITGGAVHLSESLSGEPENAAEDAETSSLTVKARELLQAETGPLSPIAFPNYLWPSE